MPLRSLILLIILCLLPAAFAQNMRIGVVIPAGATEAAVYRAAVDGASRRIALNPVASMRQVQLLVREAGSPAATVTAVTQLIDVDEVHAVVCCSSQAAADQAAAVAATRNVLLISPAQLDDPPSMALTLQPSELTRQRALALAAGGDIGLLTTGDAFGAEVTRSLEAGTLEAGTRLTRTETFHSGTRILTPEALLVATSTPATIAVMTLLPADARSAITALRARGYDGEVWLPWPEAASLSSDTSLGRLRYLVPPVAITGTLPGGSPNQQAVSNFRVYSGTGSTDAGAALYVDAIQLLLAAHEQALAYGVSTLSIPQYRLALADGLTSTGTQPLAAGTYAWDGRTASLARPSGLIPAMATGGRFTPLR